MLAAIRGIQSHGVRGLPRSMQLLECMKKTAKAAAGITLAAATLLACSRADGKPYLLIYYTNETVPESFASPNNQALFAALAHENEHAAAAVRSIVRSDAEHFEPSVNVDIAALVVIAKTFGFDLAVFTNKLALSHRFLSVVNGITIDREFDGIVLSTKSALLFSPLSIPHNLRLALQLALGKPASYAHFAFILNTHGTKTFAAVPRVAADFLTLPPPALAHLLNDSTQAASIKSLVIAGITKEQFWNTLALTSREKATNLSIVISESCESGPYTWKQYETMRSTDTLIAHTGFGSTAYGKLKISALGEALYKPNTSIDEGLLELAQAAGYWDSELVPLYIWPTLTFLSGIPKSIYFVPLVVWLAMLPSTLRLGSFCWQVMIAVFRKVWAQGPLGDGRV